MGASCLYSATSKETRQDKQQQTRLSYEELGEQFYQKHFQTVGSNPAASISDLKQSAAYFAKASQVMKAASSLARIGQIYTNLGMHQMALEYLLEVYKILQNQPASAQVAWLYSDIGNVYFGMEQTDLAEPYYWQGLRMMKSLDDTFGQSVMLNNIGFCKMKQAKPDSALAFYQKALKLRESTKDRFAIYHSLNFLGETYHSMGNTALAQQYYLKVFNDLMTPAEPSDASNALRASTAISLHKLYKQLNKTEFADKYIEEAINILSLEQDSFRLNDVLKLKAESLLKQGNSILASGIYEQIYLSASKNGFLEQAKNAAYQLGTIYLQQDNHAKALQYWNYYAAYYDSLYAQRSPATLVRLHSSVQNNLKELENQELKTRQRNNTRFAIITMILLGIIILLFVRSAYADKRHIKRLHQLADASFEGIIFHDNGIVLEVNDRFLDILGLTRTDCIGHHITGVTNLDVDSSIDKHVKAGGIQNYELEVETKYRGILCLEIMSRPYTYINKRVRVAAIRDITEKKRFITTLLETQKQLKDLNATKDKLFSIIAHDLQNPFSAIIGFSEMLRENIEKFTPAQVYDMIVQVHETSTATHNLLQNLLEWAKIQIGAESIYPIKFAILPAINDAVFLIKAPLAAKEISLRIKCGEEVKIYADALMLHSILNNLLSNALKFTPPKGEITITVSQNDTTTIEISDTGIGMETELLSNLFKVESIRSRKGTNNESGTGIGLILCKEMIALHNGTIEVSSFPNQGTQFRISFPA
jgi:PAS domain S-box-containing protein